MGTRQQQTTKPEIRLVTSNKSWIEGLALQQLEKTTTLPSIELTVGVRDLHPDEPGGTFLSALLADQADSAINASDVSFETVSAKGPGGQHTNNTNKRLALAQLRDKISKTNQSARSDDARNRWQQQEQIERGNLVKKNFRLEFKERQMDV